MQMAHIRVIARADVRLALVSSCETSSSHLSAHTPARLRHCLQVTNTGLAEFTSDHAPLLQLVATLVMTSLLCAPIGSKTLLTYPIKCRRSDVSNEWSGSLSLLWAGRGDGRRQNEQDAEARLAEGGESEILLLREKGAREQFARGNDASAAPQRAYLAIIPTFKTSTQAYVSAAPMLSPCLHSL